MRQCILSSLVFAIAAHISGCAQKQESTASNVDRDQNAHQEPLPEVPQMHQGHQHHHAFVDAHEKAKKWNDPERDKWQHPEEIVKALGLKPGMTIADIGAGTGYMVAHMSKAVGEDGTIVAIDSSPQMVKYLAERDAEFGPAKIVPRQVEANDPGLQIATVDAVLTLDTWHHVGGHEEYAKKVYDGLKPDGRFVVVDYDVDAETGPPMAMRLAPEQVAKHLETAGFRVEIANESMPRHYMVVGHKTKNP